MTSTGDFKLCQKNDLRVPAELSSVERLSPFGVRLRYGTAVPSGLDRDQALRWAASAIEWARSLIEPANG